MNGSLFFYIFSFLISVFLFNLGIKKKDKKIIYIGLLIPILICGLRYYVGTDYPNYIRKFNIYSNLSLTGYISTYGIEEILFFLINKISYILIKDYTLMFLISAFLTVTFFYKGIINLNCKHKTIIYFLYLFIYFPSFFNNVRQGIALSIAFYSITFLINRKPAKYFITNIIAIGFHSSVIIMFPLYFISFIKSTKISKNIILTIILSILLYLCFDNIFTLIQHIPFLEKYTRYETYIVDSNNLAFYLKLMILLIIIFFSTGLVKNNKQNNLLISLSILELSFSTLGFISSFVNRITLYFSYYSILLLSDLKDSFHGRHSQFVYHLCILIYGIGYFILSYYILGHSNIFPYNFIGGNI